MEFEHPLHTGRLSRRYKRFLADIELDDGATVTAHCPNSGSMATCKGPGQPAAIVPVDSAKRKLKYTWELYHSGASWVGINTHRANAIVAEALANEQIPELTGYPVHRREVRYGQGSRVDILLSGDELPACYVEVKNATLLAGDGRIRFPDAVTERGRKHLDELMEVARSGGRAVMFFLVNRADGDGFGPADHIDPAYGARLREAATAGVEVLAYGTRITTERIEVAESVAVDWAEAGHLPAPPKDK